MWSAQSSTIRENSIAPFLSLDSRNQASEHDPKYFCPPWQACGISMEVLISASDFRHEFVFVHVGCDVESDGHAGSID